MAPEQFSVQFETTKGSFVTKVTREWSPLGVDRFHELVESGFFSDVAFFRVLDGFVAQFGINGDPEVQSKWRDQPIGDDPVKGTNTAGTISFAMAGPGTRTTQLFINLADNARLDGMGFSPIAEVTEGMDVVLKLYGGYGEGAPRGGGPDQGSIQQRGNEYLKASFPDLDYITSATIAE